MRVNLKLSERLDELSYPTIFLLWASNVGLFASVFVALSYIPGHGPTGFDALDLGSRVWNALYFSVITATNTGYGDILPLGFAKLFAAAEAFSGLFLFALFMAKLVSHKQDMAIRQMHRLSFEGTFHNLREDLHVVRGDFDKVIRMVRERTSMSPDEWELLRVAYGHMTGLLREILHFYDDANSLYRIDARCETLLIEAFHRTFRRLDTLLSVLETQDINWIAHEECVAELREMIRVFDEIIPLWRGAVLRESPRVLEELAHLVASIRTRLSDAYPIKGEM